MPEAKLLHNKTRLQRWWDLSRLLTNIFVNFGNFFNSIILSPFLLRKKYLQKTEEWAIPVWLEDNDKNLGGWGRGGGEGEFCLRVWVKMNRFNFLTHKYICSNLNTINLKVFRNHSGIYRFKNKFKKDSWEINPSGVHRNMRVCILEINCECLGGNQQYVCLPIC